MSEDYGKELLRSGIIEAKSGSRASAQRYFDRALSMLEDHDDLADGWFWMSEVLEDAAEKRKALENCLAHDLHHARARRALAILDGKLKADDLVNPDQLPIAANGVRDAKVDRFICPNCGGRMSFAPDGQSLVCDFCASKNTLADKTSEEEKDFIMAMATMKGHGKPLQEQAFHCDGCGAEFFLPPGRISASCVYCGSAHVVSLENVKDLLAPDAILPHQFDQREATRVLIEWVETHRITPQKKVDLPRGLYLPLWTFDIGGALEYTAELIRYENDDEDSLFSHSQTKTMRITEQYPVMANDIPVPAARKLGSVYSKLVPTFDLKALKPYNPRYLANWPADIYDLPMADASLDARSIVYKKSQRDIPNSLNGYKVIRTSSAGLMVESFKLNLLPVWMTEIPQNGKEYLVLINGQNGEVRTNLPGVKEEKGGLFGFLDDLLGE